MSKKKYVEAVSVALIALAAAVISGTGAGWGLPSAERISLLSCQEHAVDSFFDTMKRTRDNIYEHSEGGSPVGRLRDGSKPYMTPVLKSMGITSGGNIFFDGGERTLANFMRPYYLRSTHTDEQMTLVSLSSMKPGKLDLNPRMFAYGGAYIYGMGAVFGAAHLTGAIKLQRDIRYYFKNPGQMGKIFELGRRVNAAAVAVIIVLVYLIVKNSYSLRAAYLAASAVALYPGLVFQAHIMKPYVISLMFFLACVYFSLLMVTRAPKTKYFALAGAFGALSASSIVIYSTVLVAPFISYILTRKKDGYASEKNLAVAFLAAGLLFVVTNPYWILKFTDLVSEMKGSRGVYASGLSFSGISKILFENTPNIMTPAVFVMSALGILYAGLKREKADLVMLGVSLTSGAAFVYLLQGSPDTMHLSRFFLPAHVLAIMLAARFIDGIFAKKALFLALSAAFLVQPVNNDAVLMKKYAVECSPHSTRTLSAEWINVNIKQGAVIGLAAMPEPAFVPPFRFADYRIALIRNPLSEDMKKVEYIVTRGDGTSTIDPEVIKGEYGLIKRFESVKRSWIFKAHIPFSQLNPDIDIYRRSQ
ncbi:MAG: glycosyltransferase family 39 protein [Endomicrobiales bacterium]|nr:glycosyltransferase family 39 protein [Endomicrobiales bacterium]